jgi:hypothetical protein
VTLAGPSGDHTLDTLRVLFPAALYFLGGYLKRPRRLDRRHSMRAHRLRALHPHRLGQGRACHRPGDPRCPHVDPRSGGVFEVERRLQRERSLLPRAASHVHSKPTRGAGRQVARQLVTLFRDALEASGAYIHNRPPRPSDARYLPVKRSWVQVCCQRSVKQAAVGSRELVGPATTGVLWRRRGSDVSALFDSRS